MKLEERLGANKYYVDETSPHIIVDGAGFGLEEKMKLVNGCPAGLYTLQENAVSYTHLTLPTTPYV